VIKRAHKRKTPLIFLKLDIAKAFGSLKWGFLLQVLKNMGFGQRWRDLISHFGYLLIQNLVKWKLGQAFQS
jgi:hypothetical protein